MQQDTKPTITSGPRTMCQDAQGAAPLVDLGTHRAPAGMQRARQGRARGTDKPTSLPLPPTFTSLRNPPTQATARSAGVGPPEGPTATPKATLRLDCTYMSQHRGYQSLSPPVCFSLHRFPCLSPPTTHHVTITGGCTRERWGGGQTSRRGEKPTNCRDSTHD